MSVIIELEDREFLYLYNVLAIINSEFELTFVFKDNKRIIDKIKIEEIEVIP